MTSDKPLASKIAVFLFIVTTCADWLYVLWVKAQPIINNPWFVLTPIIGYFYFTFAFIAIVWMYYRKRIGVNLAYCVLMFGTAADVLSYSLVYNKHQLIEFMIIPMIGINLFVVFYIAYCQSYFTGD